MTQSTDELPAVHGTYTSSCCRKAKTFRLEERLIPCPACAKACSWELTKAFLSDPGKKLIAGADTSSPRRKKKS
jgi:hypothetical protein